MRKNFVHAPRGTRSLLEFHPFTKSTHTHTLRGKPPYSVFFPLPPSSGVVAGEGSVGVRAPQNSFINQNFPHETQDEFQHPHVQNTSDDPATINKNRP